MGWLMSIAGHLHDIGSPVLHVPDSSTSWMGLGSIKTTTNMSPLSQNSPRYGAYLV